MKNLSVFFISMLLLTLSSCQLIGDIFNAGVWVGVLLVVVIIGLIVFIISRVFGS